MMITPQPLTSMRCILAVLLIVLLPSIALASLAAIVPPTLAQAGNLLDPTLLADKNMNYWFLALAGITIGSWTFTAKWLLQQLESQRSANTELVNKLVGYMEKDHSQTLLAMNTSAAILAQVVDKLDLQSNSKPS